jgi:hypothetical protein
MSLEISIQNLADAINNLAKASAPSVRTALNVVAGADTAELIEAAATKPTDAKGAVAAAKAAAIATADKKATEAEAARVAKELEDKENAELLGTGGTEAVVYDYDKDVAPLLNALLKRDKQALLDLLKEYGAKNGQGLKNSDYPAIVAKLSA